MSNACYSMDMKGKGNYVMEIIRIAALAIVGVLIAIQFKSYKSEYGLYIGLGISILIFFFRYLT